MLILYKKDLDNIILHAPHLYSSLRKYIKIWIMIYFFFQKLIISKQLTTFVSNKICI